MNPQSGFIAVLSALAAPGRGQQPGAAPGIEANLRPALLAMVLLTLALSAVFLWTHYEREQYEHLLEHAERESRLVTALPAAVSRYVAEARGYALLGDAEAGARFAAARRAAAEALLAAERAHAEHPVHGETFGRLRLELEALFAFHDGMAALRRGGDDRAAIQYLRRGDGPARIDAVYALAERVRREERRILDDQARELARRDAWMWGSVIALALAQIALLALGYAALRAEFRRRTAALQDLAASETAQRATFEQAAVGIAHISTGRRILRANEKLAQLLGCASAELLGMALQDLSHPEDREAISPDREEVYAGAAARAVVEKRYLRCDGAPVWMRVSMSLVRDAAGRPDYEIAVFEDISAERRAAAELRRFRAALDATQDAVYITSRAARRIVDVNAAACGMLGYARDELVGADPRKVLGEAGTTPAQLAAIADKAAAGSSVAAFTEAEHRRKDGSLVPVEVQRSVLEVEGEAYLVSVARDISERAREARMRALEHAVTRCIAEADSATSGLRAAIRAISESEGWQGGRYFGVDAQAGVLRSREWWCDAEVAPQWSATMAREVSFAPGEGIAGRAWQSGEPIWVPDITADARFVNAALASAAGIRAALVVPVTSKGTSIGVLAFFSSEARAPDARLLAAARVAGSQIGQFLLRRRAERAARLSSERLANYAALSPAISYALVIEDGQLRPEWVSDNVERLLGYPIAEALQPGWWQAHLHPDDRARVMAGVAVLLREGELHQEYRFLRKDGSILWVQDEVRLARAHDGGAARVAGAWVDISERKRAEAQHQHLANFDTVTGLANRTLFVDRLGQALAQAVRNQWQVGLLFADLDRFKRINDTLGHDAGDALLRAAGARLQSCLRAGDTVARLGGDEFAVVLPDLESAAAAGAVAAKMLAALDAPFELAGEEVQAGASIGITVYPADAADADALLRNADIAMYRAKDAGRHGYQFFTPGMNAGAAQRLALERDLRHALDRGEFELHYQPKAAATGALVTGAEALLRWRRPGGELVSPVEFIPVLEDMGLIVEVGDWVIAEACRQLRRWNGQVPKRLSVAVNVSAQQFRGERLLASVKNALAAAGCAPERLQIEITESMAMHDVDVTINTLQALRALGVRVAVDDFGTGYSSLAYLKRLPIDIIKVDRSFVRDINDDADDAAIATAVVAMGRALGYRVVAEGVETQLQRQFLEALGCDEIQGYLLSRPLPADEFLGWLAARCGADTADAQGGDT